MADLHTMMPGLAMSTCLCPKLLSYPLDYHFGFEDIPEMVTLLHFDLFLEIVVSKGHFASL